MAVEGGKIRHLNCKNLKAFTEMKLMFLKDTLCVCCLYINCVFVYHL